MTRPTGNPRGRPPGPRGRSSPIVGVRLTVAEYAQLTKEAAAMGTTPAELLRMAFWATRPGVGPKARRKAHR